jgi:shikimate dehydrogenase
LPRTAFRAVTIPHKEAAFRLASEKDATARAIGAANTLWLDGSRLCASNTDTYGFMTHLNLSAPGWQRRDAPISVLGAGGAARAIVFGATSLGLKNEGSLDMDFARFHPDCVVSDIVYVPLETGLIRDARTRGLKTVDGLGMLLHQAVPGFEKWFGRKPEVTDELHRLIAAGIEAC